MNSLPYSPFWSRLNKGIGLLAACALIGTSLESRAQQTQPIQPAPQAKPAKPADPAWFNTFETLSFPYQKSLPYRLLKPTKIIPGKTYPLLVFLHGAGERGNDNVAQLRNGVGDILKFTSAKYPCFILAPQCETTMRWVEVDWSQDSEVMPQKPSEPMGAAIDLINKISKKLPIDSKRIYIAGLSMGGFGTWDAISRYPDKFAAAVPVCGGGDTALAPKLVKIPIWAFHGDKDMTVKTHRSRDMIDAIKAAGGNPKYTELPGVGHGAWGPAFSTPELYDWLFAQTLKTKAKRQ